MTVDGATRSPHDASAPDPGSRARVARPGWPEIAVGVIALVAAGAVLPLARPLTAEMDPVAYGLVLTAWSGVVGLVGFTAAALVRIRSWAAFSVRRTTWRWMAIGLAGGVVAFLLKGVLNTVVVTVAGSDAADPQSGYYGAAGGGVLPLVLTVLFLSVLTPLGEELFFRGVITNALLRYGAVVGVLSSSVVFALFHGINLALPSALVVGIVAAEVMRRSGSIWPAVLVHVINNLGLPLLVLISGATGPA
ncbi:CPBP family intramembrane glutamic endopeptidase [Auraticoccus monumenti]|uniref:CAAX prenyl protease 2/Lysostaphin resistance protein A-like domain-containing protein n=1 Tax=Auraticoccus monumenti TaxID=675864 RepID=A0A1G6WR91_9ACTN|nr:type II CAAX endopeptidase family protein [Auraticoccus monumenti]SDD67616.1 hypothetical protein SAMN04489747_1496 [Auraticoccus monumenti]